MALAFSVKKRLLPSPCGRLLSSPWSAWPDDPETDTRTIDQAVGGAAEPNISVFSSGPHLRRSTITDLGAAWVGLLIGWSVQAVILHPSLFVEVSRYDCAVVEREANPQAVGCDQRQDRPHEHALE